MLSMSKLAIALAIGIASASIIGGSYVFVKLKPQMRNWHVFTQLSFYSIMVLLKHSSNYNRTYPNQFFLFHYGTTETKRAVRPELWRPPFYSNMVLLKLVMYLSGFDLHITFYSNMVLLKPYLIRAQCLIYPYYFC